MPRSHSWIFQATPRSRDLAADLRAGDALSWSVSRYGHDLRPGDRVYYWQAGRDAGIYGVGSVQEVSSRGPDGRYTVRTAHERPLFAPITRAELRADDTLADLAVLRQPRGTVFPLTTVQDVALAGRAGIGALVIAVSANRVAGNIIRLHALEDDVAARVGEARARGDEVVVVTVAGGEDGEDADGAAARVARARVVSIRTRRDGATVLRIARLSDQAPRLPVEIPAEIAAEVGEGRAVLVPVAAPPSTSPTRATLSAGPIPGGTVVAATERADTDRGAAARVAEARTGYGGRQPFAPSATELYGDLALPGDIAPQLVAAVNGGRHIVLMGLPGTGKTSLALNLARAAARAGLCAAPLLATATADWTTFDTIGGLVPGADGSLRFSAGVALRALRDNRWLILDELNRADIDKAFGPLLTVLAGAAVELPNVDASGRAIRVEPAPGPAGLLDDGVTYRAGTDWRIVSTINTLDRAALFAFSLAFARRFAFILVPPPDPERLLALVRARAPLNDAAMAVLRRVLAVTPRPLGPAVLLDAADYIAARADAAAPAEALGLFVLPQLEGLARASLADFASALAPLLGRDGDTTLRAYLAAFGGEG